MKLTTLPPGLKRLDTSTKTSTSSKPLQPQRLERDNAGLGALESRLGLPSKGSSSPAPRSASLKTNRLESLPNELIAKILENVDVEDLHNLAEVSGKMRVMVKGTPESNRRLMGSAQTVAAAELRKSDIKTVSKDLGKFRVAEPILNQKDIASLADRTADALLKKPEISDIHDHGIDEFFASHQRATETSTNLARLAGALIGTGKLDNKGAKKLAGSLAKAAPATKTRNPRSLLVNAERSTLMGAALANVKSSDPSRYKPLTDRVGNRLHGLTSKVSVLPVEDEDSRGVDEMPQEVLAKVSKYRGGWE